MKKIVIVGGGPSGLMTAHTLVKRGFKNVHVFDANKALARKFLVAGHGGFNLSNSRDLEEFISVYNHQIIRDAVCQFTNNDTVDWLDEIGIPTYVGSSGKIFPEKGIKPIEVLNAWLLFLEKHGVTFRLNHRLVDFSQNEISFQWHDDIVTTDYNVLVLAMGGASWSKTGSSGDWMDVVKQRSIKTVAFEASNAGIEIVNWRNTLEGNVLKNVNVSIGSADAFGEIELTHYGFEGAPIYALSHQVRAGSMQVVLNLKPVFSSEQLSTKFAAFKGSKSDFLKSLKLGKAAISLLKGSLSKEQFMDSDAFLSAIQSLNFDIASLRPLEEAISTVGGVSMDEIDAKFRLRGVDNLFVVGEMLDWDAPTGGYLLQACFASGFVAGESI